ncbi:MULTISPECIES: ribose 5-phosphate isomerase B [unclassified Salinicola]|uniref:ribose 5-phosphate isomerase B n=1 Tax=unclassified Salinicola TaxID=2634022 RepID=UPI001A8D2A94|nr:MULTISPECIES: ribose 5-phosphate isomerase B [unclassified Salinicola]MCE3028430.1 ribose 5-phosphate isomerase B [Salinicola sp. DM10]WIX33466.1 ribose 5-phosphate isomerase B [Salinicola sp. JS01]
MAEQWRVAVGCDEAAYEMKQAMIDHVRGLGHEVEDFGTHDGKPILYPDVAFEIAQAIAEGRFDRGVLMCGTGIGVAISANKVAGIRAAQAHDTYSAERARKSNDAQIVTMGARVIGVELAKVIATTFLSSEYEPGGRSQPKIDRIDAYERERR